MLRYRWMWSIRPRRCVAFCSGLVAFAFASSSFGQQDEPAILPQRGPQMEAPHTASGTTSITPRGPGDTEVIQAERGVINPPVGTFIYPLEQPLDPKKYFCNRGDTFELNFWGQQNFRLRVTVDIEGRTFISKVGYVDIVGKSLSEAREIIKKAVHRYYPGLNFDLSLASPRAFLVHVVGYVSHAGLYVATPLDRVASVLKRAGGANGSRRRIEIEHRAGAKETADLLLYELNGDTSKNPFVSDGDTITVPYPDLVVSITGAVRRPGDYELIGSKDVNEAMSLADGFTDSVTRLLPVRLVRRDPRERLIETTLKWLPNGGAENTTLRNGDWIGIPGLGELQRSVLLIGPVAGASAADEATLTRRMPFAEGLTVRTLLDRAGGIGASANLGAAYIQHEDGTTMPVDLEALIVRRDFSADRPVHLGDTVVIPQRRHAVEVRGAVFKPGSYPYNPAFSFSEYVTNSGGPTKEAKGVSSYKLVSPEGKMKKISLMTKVLPGDTIVVPERPFARSEIVQLVIAGAGLLLSSATVIYLVATR